MGLRSSVDFARMPANVRKHYAGQEHLLLSMRIGAASLVVEVVTGPGRPPRRDYWVRQGPAYTLSPADDD